jgi:NAD(P)-dependent dehydrogenase (short-subunit alcohol dehydrogenase family)
MNDPFAMFRLDGKVSVVVGGGGGLGRAVALGLAGAGASVAVVDIEAERAQQTAAVCSEQGQKAIALGVDITSHPQVAAMAEEVHNRLGPIEVLVNAAGITRRYPAVEFPETVFDEILAVNLKGVFLCCQEVGRHMISRRQGKIVNFASIAGQIGLSGTIAYLCSKGGVVQLTRGLAVEWAQYNIRVNAIAPSWFETNMGRMLRQEPQYQNHAMRRVPLGRMGQPEELIGAVLYLASDASSMVTGHVLAVDGGTLAA